jgi:hypothetical protein
MELEGTQTTLPLAPILGQINTVQTPMQFLRDQFYMIIPPTPRSFKSSLPSGFPTKTLCSSLLSSYVPQATIHPHFTVLDLITQVIFDMQCRS